MSTLFRMYGECLALTGKSLRKNPWTLLLPMVYGVVSVVAAMLLAPLAMVGGFLLGLVETALFASVLYMLDEMVAGNPVKPSELWPSVRRYFWPVMSVLFVFWVAQLLVGPLLQTLPNANIIELVLMLGLFVLLNATPEAIYQKRISGGLATLTESVRFIQTHWIEWFIPNLAFLAVAVFVLPMLLRQLMLVLHGVGATLIFGVLQGALLWPVMVFRGHLFHLLDTTGPRQRKLRYRAK